MRSTMFLLWGMSLLAACSEGDMPAAQNMAADADGWMTLFDGSGLDALTPTGDANWMVEGETVGADSGNGMLVTHDQYADFELEAEFWVDVPANSGIFIRCPTTETIDAASCYEVNIFDTRADQTYRTGGIVDVAAPLVLMNTGGRWNRYEIMADGSHLRVVLNGEVVVDTNDDKHSSGYIGFQYGAGIVKFRNIRIRSL